MFEEFREGAHRILWPTSWYIEYWEQSLALALFYTLLMTPIQVAFLESTPVPIFVLNRMVDLMMLTDMILILFVAVQRETSTRKQIWITKPSVIRMHYFKGQFIIDLIGLASSSIEILEYSGVDLSSAQDAKLARFTRLIRLIRIVRMARLAMIISDLRRKCEDFIASKEVGFLTMETVKWVLTFFLVAHVWACIFGFVAIVEEGNETFSWLQALERQKGFRLDRDNDVGWIYVVSLYWAFTTLVSVGYGDIVPRTRAELLVNILLMVAGGCCWTVLMASVCSVVAVFDASRLKYGLDQDALVCICNDRGLETDLRLKLLAYIAKNQKYKRFQEQQTILGLMSPALRGEVALFTSSNFFSKVAFLQNGGQREVYHDLMCSRLAESLVLCAIQPEDWVVTPDLVQHVSVLELSGPNNNVRKSEEPFVCRGALDREYVPPLTYLDSGLAVLHEVKMVGQIWHEDMVLQSSVLRRQEVAKALTICFTYVLTLSSLNSVLADGIYSEGEKRIKSYAVKLAMSRVLEKAVESKERTLVKAVNNVWRGAAEELNEKEASQSNLLSNSPPRFSPRKDEPSLKMLYNLVKEVEQRQELLAKDLSLISE